MNFQFFLWQMKLMSLHTKKLKMFCLRVPAVGKNVGKKEKKGFL